jgi:predicted dehydrogenase
MEKLKIGVFGASRGISMMNILLTHPEAELTAVCDKYVPFLEKVKEIVGKTGQKISAYEKFDDFINHPGLDAVVLANYATEHAPFAVKALDAGKHVMSEVLACETMAQAVELIEAVERSGKVYTYAENYCYMDRTFEMWRRYERGDIGEVVYGEGEYVHDCSSITPQITYGEPDHWRNRLHPFYYCTHSFGPLMTITGLRPIEVTGIQTKPFPKAYKLGLGPLGGGPTGIEMVRFENGALVKSIHGAMKREPGSVNYELYGTNGCMETQRFGEWNLNVYLENGKVCNGSLETYIPEKFVSLDLAAKFGGHGGSDFFATHFFIQSILGRPEGKKYGIDVYQAVDMTIIGILAYRSCLNGGKPVRVPNLRNHEERDQFRNDNACTTPEVAGDQLLPLFMGIENMPKAPPEAYEHIRQLFLDGKYYTEYKDF